MSVYEFLLFVHILAAAIWLSAGLLLQVQASRADSVSDDAGLQRVITKANGIARPATT